jgi:hypothetical protein
MVIESVRQESYVLDASVDYGSVPIFQVTRTTVLKMTPQAGIMSIEVYNPPLWGILGECDSVSWPTLGNRSSPDSLVPTGLTRASLFDIIFIDMTASSAH